MSSSPFQFRQFTVSHEKAAMKVGTDSLLLGCFAKPGHASRILDIGTGTGLLALMMAQRSGAVIDAVEIDSAAFEEARDNFEASPWPKRLQAFHIALQDFHPSVPYDLIISNPPYYASNANISISEQNRAKARHDHALPLSTLAAWVGIHLAEHGKFWLILPVPEASTFAQFAVSLHMHERILVHSLPSRPAVREILCFGRSRRQTLQSRFNIYREKNEPSEEYIRLTREFLLWKELPNPGEEGTSRSAE